MMRGAERVSGLDGETRSSPRGARDGAAAVRAIDVVVAYDGRIALALDDLTLPRGRVIAVIGPNGSGKSTLLSTVSGLVTPVRGRLEVLGRPPGTAHGAVAHVLQETTVGSAVPLTVGEVVRMGRYATRGAFRPLTTEDREAVGRAMERMGVADLGRTPLGELSAGQRQRVYVAQGIAQEADLLLLDEPGTGLDLPTLERIAAIMREERAAGRTVVYTTHDVAEASRADVAVVLANRLVGAGPPEVALRQEHLERAYGPLHVTPTGAFVVDDPHHHPHEEGHR